jgi:hypothetical protein
MEIMDPYLELFMLRKNNPKEFTKLLTLCIFQHIIMIHFMYLFSIILSPFFVIIMSMYGEMFITIYLTNRLHHAWRTRIIEEDFSHELETKDKEIDPSSEPEPPIIQLTQFS